MVDGFDVEFVDGSCGPGLDAVVNLHVRFTDKLLPDGSLHHWLDLSGTITNHSAGKVRLIARHSALHRLGRRAIEHLQRPAEPVQRSRRRRPTHISGWSDDMLTHGRWDTTPTDELPPAVCYYLFG